MLRLPAFLRDEERQYVPFVGGALFFGIVLGFPLGFTVAHAAAQQSTLGGHLAALIQVHGHTQLMGWVGLFVIGMGYRLVPRFTGVRVRPPALVPLTLALVVSGLTLRAVAQPFADEGAMAALFVASAGLEAAGVVIFAGAVLRCLVSGRRQEFLYAPFFAAGVFWLATAALLNVVFVVDAARDSLVFISPARTAALAFLILYGFGAMFIFAVSMRTFPVFFGRRPAQRSITLGAWVLANVGIGTYAATLVLQSYDHTADVRLVQTGAFLGVGIAFFVVVGVLRLFEGSPHRLRESARRSMRFVRSAYFWLLVAAGLQVFFASRALFDETSLAFYEVDAVRHFIALGFITMMIIGMAFLVLPPLAMRRAYERRARLIGPLLLALLHGAAAGRGVGSLLVNESQFENGFWTMTAGGVAAILAVGVFAAYLLWPSSPPEIPLRVGSPTASPER